MTSLSASVLAFNQAFVKQLVDQGAIAPEIAAHPLKMYKFCLREQALVTAVALDLVGDNRLTSRYRGDVPFILSRQMEEYQRTRQSPSPSLAETLAQLFLSEVSETGNIPTEDIMGGGFLALQAGRSPYVPRVPEMASEAAQMIAENVRAFITGQFTPDVIKKIEDKDYETLVRLMRESGLLGAEIPEEWGGAGIEIGSMEWTALVGSLSGLDSFAVSLVGTNGIGSEGIVNYGTEAQKEKYLRRFASGELIGAYALTEPGAGSDIFSMKATATQDPDTGEWILNGDKCFITNAGFAGVFTVFAKVDGRIAAFIVERGTPGLEIGAEEHKMGLLGSSTCSLHFHEMRIPAGNLLGRLREGHLIAMNTLNAGRLRLGTGCIGNVKRLTEIAAKYAAGRVQSRRPIADFPSVQAKIADMALMAYAGESMTNRIAGDIAAKRASGSDPTDRSFLMAILQDMSGESSMAKVFGSRAYVEATRLASQALGGLGYMEDGPTARAYRDALVNEIFEGTNDINRLYLAGLFFKRIAGNQIPTRPLAEDLLDNSSEYGGSREAMRHMQQRLDATKGRFHAHPLRRGLFLAEMAKELATYGYRLAAHPNFLLFLQDPKGQLVLRNLAEMAISAYAIDSAVQRALRAVDTEDPKKARMDILMAETFATEEISKLFDHLRIMVTQLIHERARMVGMQKGDDRDRAVAEYLGNLIPWMYQIPPVDVSTNKSTISNHLTEPWRTEPRVS